MKLIAGSGSTLVIIRILIAFRLYRLTSSPLAALNVAIFCISSFILAANSVQDGAPLLRCVGRWERYTSALLAASTQTHGLNRLPSDNPSFHGTSPPPTTAALRCAELWTLKLFRSPQLVIYPTFLSFSASFPICFQARGMAGQDN